MRELATSSPRAATSSYDAVFPPSSAAVLSRESFACWSKISAIPIELCMWSTGVLLKVGYSKDESGPHGAIGAQARVPLIEAIGISLGTCEIDNREIAANFGIADSFLEDRIGFLKRRVKTIGE